MAEFEMKMLQLLADVGRQLSCDQHFLLGVWLEDAKAMAKNEQEALQYEFNARNQITLWGPLGEDNDYAAKQWSGVMSE